MEIKIKSQKEFPYINQFKIEFKITENNIFCLGDTIFTDKEIPYDIFFHEQKHLKQQKKIGEKIWIENYLNNKNFRLKMEIEAYRYQLLKVRELTKNDREEINNIRNECIRNLTNGMYGVSLGYSEVVKALKI